MSERAELKKICPVFVVPDVVKTAEYYRGVLGFKVLGYFLDPPVYAMLEREGVEIHFGRSDNGASVTNESARRGLGIDAYIFVNDVRSLYDEFTQRGAEVIEGPVKREYDCLEIVVRDLNGFKLAFGE